jgi:hypothetical protein
MLFTLILQRWHAQHALDRRTSQASFLSLDVKARLRPRDSFGFGILEYGLNKWE